jgi:transketolase
MALGAAIAERFLCARFGEWMAHKTYTYISDGGVQEEISQGVGRLAGHLGLHNFIMFYDSNDVQLSTMTSEVTSENTAMKYEAWGWRVITINGNDHEQIRCALKQAGEEKSRPTLIIGKTIMGKGARAPDGSSFEGKVSLHGMPLSEAGASFEKTIQNLGGDPLNPFIVFPEVAALYQDVRSEKLQKAKEAKARQAAWATSNPEPAKKLASYISGELPPIDWAAIPVKAGSATRASSSAVLATFVKQIDNMIVSSADLANSDKTDGFLKGTKTFSKGNFSGAFMQAGVSELTMAVIMNGIAAHGGVIPVCGTFFAFSDYMKPAIRLGALMGLPVKFIFTHDSFRVGEDGPTHQPIEQETQLRLLEKMSSPHSGGRSLLVLRPADSAESVIAWKMALECNNAPCALLLSRQNIADLPSRSGSRFTDAHDAVRGAYTVVAAEGKPDVILVANGSEVSTLVDAAAIIAKEKGIKARIVSAPSMALFFDQTPEYRDAVITPGIPVFGLTAGLPLSLLEIVGPLGRAIGLERFGASAPYKVLDEKFGFTPAIVAGRICEYLGDYAGLRKRLL